MKANNLIEFQPTHRGMMLTLPRRSLGKAKKTGWLPLVLGLFPLFFGVSWFATILKMFQVGGAQIGPANILLIVFAAFGLVPLWFGLKIFTLGIAILRDQTYASVEVTDKNLICYESFYGFSFRRKIPSLPIKQLVVRPLLDLYNNPNNKPDVDPNSDPSENIPNFIRQLVPNELQVLATSQKMGKCILAAYPERIVAECATLLGKELDDVQFRLPSARVADGTQKVPTDATNSRVRIIDSSQVAEHESPGVHTSQFSPSAGTVETDSPASPPAEPPTGSQLQVTQQDGTEVYDVPAQGWRKAKSIVWFAVFWNTFMLFFTGVTIWGILHEPQVDLWETVGIIVFEGVFWAVGIGLAIWAWNRATRSAMIGVMGEQMFVETKTIFGTKWVEFNQKQIHSISVQNSGTTVNDVPIKHLLIETADQPPMGMFSNLANEELHWLAGRLKQSLNFKWKNRLDISTAFNDDGDVIVPEETRLLIDRSVGRTTVSVPTATLGKRLMGLLLSIFALTLTTGFLWFLVRNEGFEVVIFAVLFGGVFVAIASVSFLYNSRSWTVVASPEYLTITQRWLLGTKERTFERDDIKNIYIGTTGVTTGDETHYQLVVHTHQKKKAMTLMGNWSVKELKYVAALIYESLEMELSAT